MASTRVPASTETVGELDSYLRLYERSLRAANRADTTIYKYVLAARQLIDFLTAAGMPTRADAVKREHIEAYIESFLESHKASTANTRYQSLRVFFGFLVDEGEILESPMRNMRPPIVPEHRTEVLTDDQLRALLATTAGRGFENKRDEAVLRLFIDSGMRLAELAGLRVDDLDFTGPRRRGTGTGTWRATRRSNRTSSSSESGNRPTDASTVAPSKPPSRTCSTASTCTRSGATRRIGNAKSRSGRTRTPTA
jgi:site-specific recombinase XerC